jgi:outer membrane protein assembly factor BamB
MNSNYDASLTDVFSWQLTCLDRNTGEVLWTRTPIEGHPRIKKHKGNTYASETPVTDGERVYVYYGMMGLFAYDFDGNLVWSKDFGAFPMYHDFGTGSSPCYYDGRIFLQIDNEAESFLVSLNAETGEEIWRLARDEKSNWSNPMIWKNSERVELVVQGMVTRSYEPASGRQLWELDMLGGRNSCTPSGDADRLFVANELKGEGGYLFAVKAGATGDITPRNDVESTEGIAWYTANAGIAMASPLLYQGHVYALDRRTGLVSCFNAETGETAYFRSRLPGGKAFWASPWASDGKIFCLDEQGTTHVLAAGPEFNVLGQNRIGEKFWASAALAPESLILRSAGRLYCIKNKS